MRENLAAALDFILADEGGFVLKPNGAMGNFGIGMRTLMDYNLLMAVPPPTVDQLKNLTADQAKAIYSSKLYAGRIEFDQLPAGVDYAALDAAANEGAGWGNDAKPGALKLLDMTKDIADPLARVHAISEIRLDRKRKRPDWNDYTLAGKPMRGHGPGWTKRIGVEVPERAEAMIGKTS